MARYKRKSKRISAAKSTNQKLKPLDLDGSDSGGYELSAPDTPFNDHKTTDSIKDLQKPLMLDGPSTKVPFDKKKVAPRSSEQFKVGPKFKDTEVNRKIYITSSEELVIPTLNARVDRGFDLIDGEWIGYKRNYFTLVSAFKLLNKDHHLFFTEKFHVLDDDDQPLNITCFALRLVSTCCEDDIEVNLIQHTAKRDRGPQYQPPVFPAIPGDLPSHSIVKQSSNIRNDSKIDQFNKLFFLNLEELHPQEISDDSIIQSYPEGNITTVARYERMQFSTSINYRKPALVNRHFILKVELLGVLGDGRYTVLASIESPPLIVRGRSPSNYNSNKEHQRNESRSVDDEDTKFTPNTLIRTTSSSSELSNYNYMPFYNDYSSKSDLNFRSSPISKLAFDRSSIHNINSSSLSRVPTIYHDAQSYGEPSSPIHRNQSSSFSSNILRGIEPNSSNIPNFLDELDEVDCIFNPLSDFTLDDKPKKHRHHKHKHKHKHRHHHKHKHRAEPEKGNKASSPVDEKENVDDIEEEENFELDIDSSFSRFKYEMEELQKEV